MLQSMLADVETESEETNTYLASICLIISISLDWTNVAVQGTAVYSTSVIPTSKNTAKLWYSRLGFQVFYKCLETLKNILNFDLNKHDESCVVFPLTKQKRWSFTSRYHISTSSFDLIHVDIWGPLATTYAGYKYLLSLVDDCTPVYLGLYVETKISTIFPTHRNSI